MKIYFYAIALLVLLSCNDSNPVEKTSSNNSENGYQGKNVGSRLDTFVSSFLGRYENIRQNDLVLQNAKKDFYKEIFQQISKGILDTVTFTSFGVTKGVYEDGIHSTFSYGVTSKDSAYVVNIYVDVSLSEEMGLKIKEFSRYKVTGDFSGPYNSIYKKIGTEESSVKMRKVINGLDPNLWTILIDVHDVSLNIKDFKEIPRPK